MFGQEDEVFFCPALPLEEVFDPTGAGDSFAGGFLGYMASKNATDFETMKQAIVYGSATASFCVEKFGTERLESLKPDEVRSRLMAFKALTQFEIKLTP